MIRPLPVKKSLLFVLILLLAISANAQQSFFQPVAGARVNQAATQQLRQFSTYRLNEPDLRRFLVSAPLEFQSASAALKLTIPLPDGTNEVFSVLESPILSPAIAAKHPDIKTYTGTGSTHKNYSVRLSLTGSGFDAIILGVDGDAVYFTKASTDPADALYLTYFALDAKKPEVVKPFGTSNKCGNTAPPTSASTTDNNDKGARRNNTGTTLRTFRLAVAATGEFTAQKGAGNVTNAFNALVGYVNRMNAVYRVELSVAFTLVSDATIVYPNAATDPYDNTNQSLMLDQNQTNLDNTIGTANYDVGHVLGTAGGSGGGVASTPSVCDATYKGKGVSGVGDGSFAPVFDDQLISHEVGHQFGMSHTFNSSLPVCTTREATTSVEPGAGATIMSYGFTCDNASGNDNYEAPYQPFLNFHTASYKQALDFINTIACFTSTPLANSVPVITSFPNAATVPKSTPFMLTGAATDANGSDVLSYAWEGTNIGTVVPDGTTLANTDQPPFFRSYAPTATGTRIFPRLSAILNGTNYAKGDKLASVGIATTLRLIVRDGVGGLTYNNLTITVDGNSGPFLETTNLAGSYPGSSTQTITWSVANTTAPPVSCPTVDILLSTDGGLTFPTVLVANTPNDGTEPITLPAVLTTTARIKVAGSNTIFFDISNVNFAIEAPVLPVTLRYFRAEPAVNQVRLSWATASEHNSDRFIVERSTNLGEFSSVGSITAAGESAQLLSYGLNDSWPLPGLSYYRLVQTDRDGQRQTSKPVAVRLDETAPLLLVTPNPVSSMQIRYRLLNMPSPTITLVTLAGRPVAIQSITGENTGDYLLRTAIALPGGVYVLRAVSDSAQLSQRVVVVE